LKLACPETFQRGGTKDHGDVGGLWLNLENILNHAGYIDLKCYEGGIRLHQGGWNEAGI